MPGKKSKKSKGLFGGRRWFATRKSQALTVMLTASRGEEKPLNEVARDIVQGQTGR